MMRYGIPKYRLPREILDKEIARIEALGVTIRMNHKVEDLQAEMTAGGYDAVFLGTGATLARRAYIPAGDSTHILDAVSVLRSMEGGRKAPARAQGRRLRRRQHRDRRRAYGAALGVRIDRRLPPHARARPGAQL